MNYWRTNNPKIQNKPWNKEDWRMRIRALSLAKRAHWTILTRKRQRTICRISTSTIFIIKWLITLWSTLRKRLGLTWMILSITLTRNKRVRISVKSILRRIINSSSIIRIRLPKLKSRYLITCILLARGALARSGKLNIKRLKINMLWNKCWSLCNYQSILESWPRRVSRVSWIREYCSRSSPLLLLSTCILHSRIGIPYTWCLTWWREGTWGTISATKSSIKYSRVTLF